MTVLRALAIALLLAIVVIGYGWWELSLWHECRTDHSFFYCWRVLS